MDYTQVLSGILCNDTNTTLHLQKISFLSIPWKLHSLLMCVSPLLFSAKELSALGKYEEFLLAPGSLYWRPLRKRHTSFLIHKRMPRNNLHAAVSKANSVLGCISQDFSSRSSEDCLCVLLLS